MFRLHLIAFLLFTSIDLVVNQRKVNRNAQVGADVKRASFACPEEFGYYPHPTDCTQYYVCVYGGALLESCTGGLMYSHELQTCDWPRNVGCSGDEGAPTAAPAAQREEPRQRYATPPPAQPAAVITSRGQPRQLHHNQQEIIKQRQQQQLYADAEEEVLPQAEEEESDRQQRVYRGQPSTLSQVQKDRDGIRHTNAISAYTGRGDRIGVISFGTQQSQQPYSIDVTNDLTLRRRRKRQTKQRSRQRLFEPSWFAREPKLEKARFNEPINLQPPPLPTTYLHNYQNTYPQHQISNLKPTHTTANQEPFAPIQNSRYYLFNSGQNNDNFSYYKLGTDLGRKPNYYESIAQPHYTPTLNTTHVVISNPNIKSVTSTTPASLINYEISSKEGRKGGKPNEFYYLDQPSSYSNTKTKFDGPLSNFDHFLTSLRDHRLVDKPIRAKVTPNPLEAVSKPFDDYYYYDDEDRNESHQPQTPKKKYSSQIKPIKNYKLSDYYYEYEDEPAPSSDFNNLTKVGNSGEVKYSAKYQGKPLKMHKNVDVVVSTTSETVITSSTTQKPKQTQRTKPTIPTTRPSSAKQRQRLTDDDSSRLRLEQSSAAPVAPSVPTATSRTLYNRTQYNSNYDPYYAIYDDDVELYKDVDYPQHYTNSKNVQVPHQSFRQTPAPNVLSTTTEEEQPKHYVSSNYNQDIQQSVTAQDYNDDNTYNSQLDDQSAYRQVNRQPIRGDRNDLNYIEEATTKRTTSTTIRKPTTATRTATTTTTTLRTIPPKKNTIPSRDVTVPNSKTQFTLRDDPGPNPLLSQSPNSSQYLRQNDTYRHSDTFSQSGTINAAVVNKPTPFTLPKHLTETPILFHYVTKPSRSTTPVSTESSDKFSTSAPQPAQELAHHYNKSAGIIPTTYSPPKFFIKNLLFPKAVLAHEFVAPSEPKTVKSVRKLISPLNVNYGLSSPTGTSYESAERLVSEVDLAAKPAASSTTAKSAPTRSDSELRFQNDELELETKLRNLVDASRSVEKRFRTTVEVPQPHQLADSEFSKPKAEPDQYPEYKIKPIPKLIVQTTTTTDYQQNSSLIPSRVSRVNNAIKSMIASGGARRVNVKCHDSSDAKCNNDLKQLRQSTRGRGSTHYANSPNIANNEVTVTVNRGTPPSRSRPTLKPSTSIVSKAQEFVDIYRFPPIRPEPIYPQPQPDKTAAKCRKDVCLLPDCSCGGKEIPGDIPVEQVPQMVLLTFDDSVNDLNKGLYSDLFEKGRTNPNGCPISATFYVSHEWTDYSQVQNLYSDGHEIASHTVSHSFGEQFSQKKWTREIAGQREILSAYGGVHLEDVRGMRAPFLSVGGNKMFKMLYDSNFTYDSSMPIYENKPPSWPYTLDYKLFHDCMIPPCPTRSYPGVWEVPMVMWQDLNGGRCSMGDACSNPSDAEGVFKMLTKNFQRHYTTNRAPFGLFYHAAWFTQPHHKEGFINFMDSIIAMKDVWMVTNWQALQWIRDPTPTTRLGAFQPLQCDFSDRPKRCNNPKVCNLWHKSGVRYMRTCQPCPDIYPWTGNSGIRSSRIDNDIED